MIGFIDQATMNKTAQISVGGIDCHSCAVTIEKNVKNLDGVDVKQRKYILFHYKEERSMIKSKK